MSHTQISGVFPHLAVKAEHQPRRTETGIGALMPWANRLWFVTYVAHKAGTGDGTGLFSVDDGLTLEKHPASVVGTYANRMIHKESSLLIIGPHTIDERGRVKTFDDLVNTRLTATCRHLSDPANKVYFCGMEGEFFEADVRTRKVTQLFDLTNELGTSGERDAHFKDAYSARGRVVVANNSYYPKDFADPSKCDGRLAEWDGKGGWRVLERTQFNTVSGRTENVLGEAIFAVGQDRASPILKMWHEKAPRGRHGFDDLGWFTYRLPRATHTQSHAWTTEWPRLREIESERWMLNAAGMFYEMAAMTYDGGRGPRIWGLRPIASHLRIIGDFCSWNGLLVMAGDQTTPINDNNPYVGQPQAGLWMGKSDDLWQWGPTKGWGGVWWDTAVQAGAASDPFLMTGFRGGCIHVAADGGGAFDLELDFRGDGLFYRAATIEVPAGGAATHVLPEGLSAHWWRLVPRQDGVATAQAHYA